MNEVVDVNSTQRATITDSSTMLMVLLETFENSNEEIRYTQFIAEYFTHSITPKLRISNLRSLLQGNCFHVRLHQVHIFYRYQFSLMVGIPSSCIQLTMRLAKYSMGLLSVILLTSVVFS